MGRMEPTTSPLAVIAFNRPHYLRPVLDSLAMQDRPAGRIALFQDGPRQTSDEAAIAANIDLFKTRFPHGEVRLAEHNLGVGLNIDRAERWLFEELAAPAGMIFEDDMVVAPAYLGSLEALLALAQADDRIGYAACYGLQWPMISDGRAEPTAEIVPMTVNWAFGMTRKCWLAIRAQVAAYVEILHHCDYRSRDLDAIHRLYRSWGLDSAHTTQDVVKTIACLKNGIVKVNSRACLGQYIGLRGVHANTTAQRHAVQLYAGPVLTFSPLDDARYGLLLRIEDDWTGRR